MMILSDCEKSLYVAKLYMGNVKSDDPWIYTLESIYLYW